MELGKQHQHGPQNSYPISARGLEGFNIPHLGRIVHHAVQTPQNVPLATASATKSCRAFFYLLSLHRSFVVKHAGFDCTKSETFIHQSKRTPICRCIQYTIVTSFDHRLAHRAAVIHKWVGHKSPSEGPARDQSAYFRQRKHR